MRKFLSIVAAVVALGTAAPAFAQSDVSVDLSVDALSGYIWRGGILGADDALVFQPSLTFGFGETGLSLNVWGSMFAMDRGTPKSLDQVDELDFTLDYSRSIPDSPISFSLGYIQYTFPSLDAGTKHSEEAYGSLSFDHMLAPSLTLYYDFGLIDDFYVTAGVGPEFPLGDQENAPVLSLGASIGFSGDGYGGSSGFNDVTLSAGVGFMAGQVSVSPYVAYSYADDSINADNSSFWGGVSIGWSK